MEGIPTQKVEVPKAIGLEEQQHPPVDAG